MSALVQRSHDIGPGRKRKRLTHACNNCRARKIRCDEARPRCTNCEKAGKQCITVDPRNPGVHVERCEAQKPHQEPNTTHGTFLTSLEQVADVERTPENDPGGAEDAPSPDSTSEGTAERLTVLPRQTGYANSLSMLSQWLRLAFLRLGTPTIMSRDSHAASSRPNRPPIYRSVAEVLASVTCREIRMHFQFFMEGLNTVFPVFSNTSVERILQRRERQHQSEHHGSNEIESILILLIIATNTQPVWAPLARTCFDVAVSNFRVIMEYPSHQAVQAMLICAIIYRWRDDTILASNMISLACSTAQALGLHRQFSRRQAIDLGSPGVQEGIFTWFSVFILEKVISMEMGRLSTIRDFECNQEFPDDTNGWFRTDALRNLFLSLLNLARLQGDMIERFAFSRHLEESTSEIEATIRKKLEMIGDLDQKLIDWARSAPIFILRSSNTTTDPDNGLILPFLNLQYWQTTFILHRNALLLNRPIIKMSADKYCADKPYRLRVKSGDSIACDAARSIVSTLNEISENVTPDILTSSFAPLIAVYALTIHILKNPNSGLVRVDAELQANATEMVARHQSITGNYNNPDSEDLRELLRKLGTKITSRIQTHSSVQDSQKLNPDHESNSQPISSATSTNTEDTSRRYLQVLQGSSTTPAVMPFLDNGLSLDMATFDFDMEHSAHTLGLLNVDWDLLTLTYGLPS